MTARNIALTGLVVAVILDAISLVIAVLAKNFTAACGWGSSCFFALTVIVLVRAMRP